jgi:hypothetical protein
MRNARGQMYSGARAQGTLQISYFLFASPFVKGCETVIVTWGAEPYKH